MYGVVKFYARPADGFATWICALGTHLVGGIPGILIYLHVTGNAVCTLRWKRKKNVMYSGMGVSLEATGFQ